MSKDDICSPEPVNARSIGSGITRIPQFDPTPHLCVDYDGRILQLWVDHYGHLTDKAREWRHLPGIEDASKHFNCTTIKG